MLSSKSITLHRMPPRKPQRLPRPKSSWSKWDNEEISRATKAQVRLDSLLIYDPSSNGAQAFGHDLSNKALRCEERSAIILSERISQEEKVRTSAGRAK